ncbi:MAG: response regulator [Planctomycetes bacterium]|nr:response regulator [Planctomycetota bacterium]
MTSELRRRILVVDDNQDILRILQTKLEISGFDVVTAKDVVSGLIRAKSDPPHLVLLDIMMPGVDGFEGLRRLRALPATAQVPVIMLTAKRAKQDVLRALSLGARDYLVKPIDFQRLMEKIQKNLPPLTPDEETVSLIASGPADPTEASLEYLVRRVDDLDGGTAPPPPTPTSAPPAAAGTEAVDESPHEEFSLSVTRREGVAVVEMHGDLDGPAVERTIKELANVVEFDARNLVVDVTGLAHFYWFKIDNLLRVLDWAQEQGALIRLVAQDQDHFQTLLRSRIRYGVVRDVEEAIEFFR